MPPSRLLEYLAPHCRSRGFFLFLLLSLNLCLVRTVQSEREGPIDVAEIPVSFLTRNTSDLMFAVNMLMWLCLIVVWMVVSMFVTDLAGNRIPYLLLPDVR